MVRGLTELTFSSRGMHLYTGGECALNTDICTKGGTTLATVRQGTIKSAEGRWTTKSCWVQDSINEMAAKDQIGGKCGTRGKSRCGEILK